MFELLTFKGTQYRAPSRTPTTQDPHLWHVHSVELTILIDVDHREGARAPGRTTRSWNVEIRVFLSRRVHDARVR